MAFNFLEPLLLLEVIVALVIFAIVILAIFFRQRFLLRKLTNKLVELRNTKPDLQNDSKVKTFLQRSIRDSSLRFEKLTHSKTVVLDLSSPYSEKVAALRYLYLRIEDEAEDRRDTDSVGWDFYEKRFEILLKLLQQSGHPFDADLFKSQLETYKHESQQTINKLKDIITNLRNLLQKSNQIPADDDLRSALNAIAKNDNLYKIRDIFEELKSLSQKLSFSPNPIEKSISSLEYEVEISDRYLTDIKANPNKNPIDFKEVKRLRDSNRVQRNTIEKLEDELKILRDSLNSGLSLEDREEKEGEIFRLERMVKEYEGCVTILEDQINNLYSQLENRKDIAEEQTSNTKEQKLADLNRELESVSGRMNMIAEDFRYSIAVNRSVYHLSNCKTINEIANQIINILKEINISAGFVIVSKIGKSDYFPAVNFEDSLKDALKTARTKEHISTLNGHSLFVASRIKLLLLNSDGNPDSIGTSISSLVCASNSNILRLEGAYALKKYREEITEWTNFSKEKISNIDIQYAYQLEEGKRIYNEFIADLKKSYSIMDMHSEAARQLESAISQYEARLELSVLNADVIDRELTALANHINNVGQH